MNKFIRSPTVVGLFFLLAMGVAGQAYADNLEFDANLSGAQQESEVATSGRGRIEARFHRAFKRVNVALTINELVGTVTGVHFHCARPGENGTVVFGLINPGPLALVGNEISGTLTNADYTGADCVGMVGKSINNIASLAFAMQDGLIYINVHTDSVPSGEIRGQMVGAHDDPPPVPMAVRTEE